MKAGWLHPVDEALMAWVQSWTTPALVTLARAVTLGGDSVVAVIGGLLLSGWWMSRGARREAVLLWAGWGVGLICQTGLRLLVAQWRPDATVSTAALGLWSRVVLAGFPSGHTFRAAFLYGWIAQILWTRRTPGARVAAIALIGLIGFVGASRVVLMRHWATDVLGAWCLALAVLTTLRLLRRSPSTS